MNTAQLSLAIPDAPPEPPPDDLSDLDFDHAARLLEPATAYRAKPCRCCRPWPYLDAEERELRCGRCGREIEGAAR